MSGIGAAAQAGEEKLRWFALRCAPQKEKVATSILQRLGYIAVTPTEERLRYRHRFDKMNQERKPLSYAVLPGCLFVAVSNRGDLWRLVNFNFISSVVGVNGRYAEFDPDKLLPFLFQRRDLSSLPAYYKYMRRGYEFDKGDAVHINRGMLANSTLKVAEITGREAVFLVPMLGKVQRVHVDVADCEKAA